MASESTPLIQTVQVGPQPRRYPHQTCRRFFTLACSCILIAGFTTFAFHAWFLWPRLEHRHGHHSHHAASVLRGRPFDHVHLQALLMDTPSAELAEQWSRYYTSGPHLAGANFSQAEWTMQRWEEWGISSSIAAYDIYQNYPLDHSLSLLKKAGDADAWDVAFEASLVEDVLDQDPTSGLDNRVPTFHGYAASGNVTAPFVYANYGTYQDFEDLLAAGVRVEGTIVIVKYGGIFRGLKVKRAQELGAVGCLIYSDPGDDGDMTEENGYAQYPDGPARQASSVQRGSVQFLSIRPGDPTTPGWPSKPDCPRAPAHESTPSIPSIPISYLDALPILKALNGHGPTAHDLGKYWTRNLGLGYKGVEYNIGPSPEGTVLNLFNEQDYVITPEWDVIGIVNGTIQNEVVVVGNHRDAWIAGGAADPNSGSAVLNEVVRSVGKALESGWKPLRTIVFASWDGEEYGLLGSTEWVEEYLPWLSASSVAYINVDVGAQGSHFRASAAPLLSQILRHVTQMVPSPNQTVPGQTIGDLWDGEISTIGSGSDFTAFQDFAGIPSIDMGFKSDGNAPVYHYHSNYDSFHWMSHFGDPGFVYHRVMAQILGLVVAEVSESLVLPFGASEYADALVEYLARVEAKLEPAPEPATDEDAFALRARVNGGDAVGSEDALKASLGRVRSALARLQAKSAELDELAAWTNQQFEEGIPWWNVVKRVQVGRAMVRANKSYKLFERNFLFASGLDGRNWFKHVVFAPGLWTGYAGTVYPGLMESIDANDYSNGLKWASIIENCVLDAVKSLE